MDITMGKGTYWMEEKFFVGVLVHKVHKVCFILSYSWLRAIPVTKESKGNWGCLSSEVIWKHGEVEGARISSWQTACVFTPHRSP
jgi:hypothetical protein